MYYLFFLTDFFQGVVLGKDVLRGDPADLGTLLVRGAWRSVNTDSIIILNFRLADVPIGGDPALMVFHHLQAYFPEARDQVLKYLDIEFSFDPSSSASVASQEKKLKKVFFNLIK